MMQVKMDIKLSNDVLGLGGWGRGGAVIKGKLQDALN